MSTIERAAAQLEKAKTRSDKEPSPGAIQPVRDDDQGTVISRDTVERDPIVASPESVSLGTPQAPIPLQEVVLDLEHLESMGFGTPLNPESPVAREFRRIKRPLLLKLAKQQDTSPPANLIMVTSSLPSEGKTFVALNLALSIAAEFDRSVLLVDADNARGDIATILEIDGSAGLVDLLERDSNAVEDFAVSTNIEHFSVLPAGRPHPRVDELFASSSTKRFFLELANEMPDRIILVDAPPVLATTEAGVLARMMGQLVFVVEADHTPQHAVMEGLEALEGCPNINAVLNKTSGGTGYGYGYSYGNYGKYGYEASSTEKTPAR